MSSLHDLAHSTQILFRIRCGLRCPTPVVVEDAAAATHMYRIAQEAVNNAIKHGRATEIVVGLRENEDHLKLTIENDGAVFPAELPSRCGMGLHTMRHRASLLGATLTIGARVTGTGTCVTCIVPKKKIQVDESNDQETKE
jgi:signal transduction histidine kinase